MLQSKQIQRKLMVDQNFPEKKCQCQSKMVFSTVWNMFTYHTGSDNGDSATLPPSIFPPLLAMITLSAVQSSTQNITSNDHSFNCPIIYMDTIHITGNDHSSTWTLFTLLAMIALLAVQSSTQTLSTLLAMITLFIVQSSTLTLFTLLAIITRSLFWLSNHLHGHFSQCYFVHWHLQQCLIQLSSLSNRHAIFVDKC